MSEISLAELLNSLQAQEQRRAMRQEDEVGGALFEASREKKKITGKIKAKSSKAQMENFRPTSTKVETKGILSSMPTLWWKITSQI